MDLCETPSRRRNACRVVPGKPRIRNLARDVKRPPEKIDIRFVIRGLAIKTSKKDSTFVTGFRTAPACASRTSPTSGTDSRSLREVPAYRSVALRSGIATAPAKGLNEGERMRWFGGVSYDSGIVWRGGPRDRIGRTRARGSDRQSGRRTRFVRGGTFGGPAGSARRDRRKRGGILPAERRRAIDHLPAQR